MKNYYKLLNVDSKSELPEIKKAFRTEIALYHPDKNPSESAKLRFDELVEAFDILSNPEKRKAYDYMLEASMLSKPIVIEEQKQYKEWQRESKKSSKKYKTTALEELLLLDIFLDAGFSGLFNSTDNLFDGVGEALGDLFDLF